MIERRATRFTEVLSHFMVRVSALGAAWVLVDLRLDLNVYGQHVQVGGSGFTDQLKGAVIALILVSGYTAVKEFWLGASATGQTQSESMSRIAESRKDGPIKAEDVKVEAAGDVSVMNDKSA